MRYFLAPEHQKFFNRHGYIKFEQLVPSQEISQLQKEIQAVQDQSPGYPNENFAVSIPLLSKIIQKYQLGEIASHLIQKRPLWLTFDALHYQPFTLDDEECGLILQIDGSAFFFNQLFEPQSADFQNWHYLFVFSAKKNSKFLVFK